MKRQSLSLALLLLSLLVAQGASADAKSEAEKRFRAGVAAQKVEDFEAAIVEFRASLDLFPTRSALFNLANSLRAAHHYAEALATLERLQSEYGEELDDEMREATERLVEELASLTAWLLVQAAPEGAEISLDGKVIGVAPMAKPIRVSVGEHHLDVAFEGYDTTSLDIALTSREMRTETIELNQLQPPPPPPPPPSPAPPPSITPIPPPPQRNGEQVDRSSSVPGWITAGSGVALLGAGTATGLWALSIDRDLEEECVGVHCPPSRTKDIDRLERLVPTTNALITVGAIATVTGITLVIIDRQSKRARRSTGVRVSASPGFVGGVVGGHF